MSIYKTSPFPNLLGNAFSFLFLQSAMPSKQVQCLGQDQFGEDEELELDEEDDPEEGQSSSSTTFSQVEASENVPCMQLFFKKKKCMYYICGKLTVAP